MGTDLRSPPARVRRPRPGGGRTWPTTRSRCSAGGSTTRSPPGIGEPNAMVVSTVSAEGRPSSRMVLLKGYDEGGLRVLHQLRLAQGAPTSPPTRPARCCCPGTTSSARCASTAPPRRSRARGVGGVLRQPAARLPARRLGVGRAGRPVVGGREPDRAAGGVRRRGGALRRGRRAAARRPGAATSCARRPWSSGRAGGAGCTTGCGTGETEAAGWSSGSRRRGRGPCRQSCAASVPTHMRGYRGRRATSGPINHAFARRPAASAEPENQLVSERSLTYNRRHATPCQPRCPPTSAATRSSTWSSRCCSSTAATSPPGRSPRRPASRRARSSGSSPTRRRSGRPPPSETLDPQVELAELHAALAGTTDLRSEDPAHRRPPARALAAGDGGDDGDARGLVMSHDKTHSPGRPPQFMIDAQPGADGRAHRALRAAPRGAERRARRSRRPCSAPWRWAAGTPAPTPTTC